MHAQLEAINHEYSKLHEDFSALVPLQTHVDLRFLSFRLDIADTTLPALPATPVAARELSYSSRP